MGWLVSKSKRIVHLSVTVAEREGPGAPALVADLGGRPRPLTGRAPPDGSAFVDRGGPAPPPLPDRTHQHGLDGLFQARVLVRDDQAYAFESSGPRQV